MIAKALRKWLRFTPRGPAISPMPTNLVCAQQRRLDFFKDAAGYLSNNRLTGAYAEFGCHTATTFRFALNTIGDPSQTANRITQFYAFDSFCGLPPPAGMDRHAVWQEGKLRTSTEEFKGKCRRDLHRITIVPGFFCDSLPACTWPTGEKIVMAYIDCDLYASCRDVLLFLSDKLAHGAILAFDDYYCFYGDPERGEQKAFADWRMTVPGLSFAPFLRYGWFGTSFIAHRQDMLGKEG